MPPHGDATYFYTHASAADLCADSNQEHLNMWSGGGRDQTSNPIINDWLSLPE